MLHRLFRHPYAPLLAFVLLAAGGIWALEAKDREIDAKRRAALVEVCKENNRFVKNTNEQFQHFVDHNNAAVGLFTKTAEELSEVPGRNFRQLGREYKKAAEYYAHLSKMFDDVPYADCNRFP